MDGSMDACMCVGSGRSLGREARHSIRYAGPGIAQGGLEGCEGGMAGGGAA